LAGFIFADEDCEDRRNDKQSGDWTGNHPKFRVVVDAVHGKPEILVTEGSKSATVSIGLL
jgi:hypothetical protein